MTDGATEWQSVEEPPRKLARLGLSCQQGQVRKDLEL